MDDRGAGPTGCYGPASKPRDPIKQTLAELFATIKRRLLETLTVQSLREQSGRGSAGHDDSKPA